MLSVLGTQELLKRPFVLQWSATEICGKKLFYIYIYIWYSIPMVFMWYSLLMVFIWYSIPMVFI